MGAWGTSLYENDSTSDIRGDYLDKLKHGKTNEQATCELLEENNDILGDSEEESLFWLALADTQWDYGRLLPHVKEKALFFLSQKTELDRWKESGESNYRSWVKTLDNLTQKLNSPMPAKKRISQYRLYKCQWHLGDVFAYCFSGTYSKEKGVHGQYVLLRKIAEETIWPGHVVPIVQIYKWMGDHIPELDTIRKKSLLVLNMTPRTLLYKPEFERKHEIALMSTSKNSIPKNNLTYIGNLSIKELPVPQKAEIISCIHVGWDGSKYNKHFEKYIIDQYFSWENVD